MRDPTATIRLAAWYHKERHTFAEALAFVCCGLWRYHTFQISTCAAEVIKVPRALVEQLTELLCYVT